MAADIYTKAFTDPLKWERACELISWLNPSALAEHDYPLHLLEASPSAGGGLLLAVLRLRMTFRESPVGILDLRVNLSVSRNNPLRLPPRLRSTMLTFGAFAQHGS
jgi:hypothetical protein